jgi:hypothetical protein
MSLKGVKMAKVRDKISLVLNGHFRITMEGNQSATSKQKRWFQGDFQCKTFRITFLFLH